MQPNLTEKQKTLLRELGERDKELDSSFESMVRDKIASLSYQIAEDQSKLNELTELIAKCKQNIVGHVRSFESYAQMYECYRKETDSIPPPENELEEPEGDLSSDSKNEEQTD